MRLPCVVIGVVLLSLIGSATGQTRQATSQPTHQAPIADPAANLIERNVKAVNYRSGGGWTRLELRGTPLLPEAKGEAWIDIKKGYIDIKAQLEKLGRPGVYGAEYLTYVLWAVTPEGRVTNLGELVRNSSSDKDAKLDVTTELQAFGLIVTAEPYFAVVRPSDTIVAENVIRRNTDDFFGIDATVPLVKRGAYVANGPADLTTEGHDIPLELAEARNAVRIATCAGALDLAPEAMQRAATLLAQAEVENSGGSSKKTTTLAREAVQTAEDARLLTVKRIEDARLADERQEAIDRAEAANARAEKEAGLRAEADRARVQADTAQRIEAERRAKAEEAERAAKDKAELIRTEADRLKAAEDERVKLEKAELARMAAESRAKRERADAALVEAEKARADAARANEEARRAAGLAEEARRAAERAERDKVELRADLARQLNLILETRDTARGLIISMSDVLFDTAQYSLKPGAREKLAKVSGILLSHPGLTLEVEGHTDNVGAEDYNQVLSERRAFSVRDFLIRQGISPFAITARGLGEAQPAASNDWPDGRQRNRRVELVVSGDPIGKPTSTEIH